MMNTNFCTLENLGTKKTQSVLPKSAPPLRQTSKRLTRERTTIEVMIHIYCRDHHEGGLCQECKGLLDYANVRLDRCRFGTEKPTCANCPVHCYRPERREQVKKVMRYAGPRMLWEHPIMSLRHWIDGWRVAPHFAQ
jgi:hypothetical protein